MNFVSKAFILTTLGFKKIVNMLMVLAYLPDEQFLPIFIQLFKEPEVIQRVSQNPELTKLFRYYHKTDKKTA